MKKIIKKGNIYPVSKDNFIGDILIENEKIIAIEENIELSDAEIIDASDLFVFPGLIEAHCHIGLHKEKTNHFSDNDTNEYTNPVTVDYFAFDAINPFDNGFKEALSSGVTTLNVYPGSSNPFGGIGTTLKTNIDVPYEKRIVMKYSAMKMALGENPKKSHPKKIITRMGTAAIIRRTFNDAINYKNKKEKEYNYKNEILLQVLNREMPVHAHAHTLEDMLTIINISEEFEFDLYLEHATESHLIPEIIKNKRIIVSVGPMFTSKYKIEVNNRTLKTPFLLSKNGIEDFALITDHPVIPVMNLPVEASMAVHYGLDEKTALKSITINPANILKISDRVGSIDVGKDADIVITDKFILDPTHRVIKTIVSGDIAYSINKESLFV